MNYLYHIKPDDMVGDKLLPINELKKQAPDVWQKHAAKYEGREAVTQQRVGILNCGWGDVIFLSAVHPVEVAELMKANGLPNSLSGVEVVKIPTDKLKADKLVALVYDDITPGKVKKHYEKYDNSKMPDWSQIPKTTKDYFEQCAKDGEEPFVYWGVTHLLYEGEIDIKDCETEKI